MQDLTVDLPEAKGAYILVSLLDQARRLAIGRLGKFDLVPGFYAYVGSAHGPGGLRARIGHHLAVTSAPHWHIDYLLRWAQPVEIWYAVADRKLERDWAEFLEQTPRFRAPIPRFGSSDYRRSRTTHLFHSKRRPSYLWFQEQMKKEFAPEVRPRQLVLRPPLPERACLAED